MSRAQPDLDAVLSGNLCTGCGGCAAVAPDAVTMRMTTAGVLRPDTGGRPLPVPARDRVAAICPGAGLTLEGGARPEHPLLGPYLRISAGHAIDPELRRAASSGGVLSAMLVHLLETGTVARVWQTGPDPARPIANRTVQSTTANEVKAAAGSRYAPSAPLEGIEDALTSGLRHAFVGKPCDVAALRALARLDARVNATFPVMLSFFCAGVPSLNGARTVLSALGTSEAETARFRYRGDGWPGYATATLRDGRAVRMSYADSWGRILSRQVQHRCKLCPDGVGSFADIVCADAWETDDRGYPVFEERDGLSAAIARTPLGARLLRDAEIAGAIALSPLDPEALVAMQPGQVRKRRSAAPRLAALRLARQPAPVFTGFHLWDNARRAGLRAGLREFLGTIRRAARRASGRGRVPSTTARCSQHLQHPSV
ncbi:Coenzyme F420 hydrogenase/dehydrogenase, beta subunit C-terminal domain [Roseivivax marinus]|uniref:Coenzyme F420 hydrogenase/dehydrogenase, beta subunit C-terminal domain n=1 Tax=Roseivivax marinus TaxID=1379903 RepID=UPI00273F6A4A|nr:Coenzyme F420 hydrogenase/dehydrogenase, beta subunit C-terminal domain [Roseivivax marinus]